jgi:protein-disulfide isomerase
VTAVRHRFAAADLLAHALVFAAVGAEIRFIWLQKYVIGQWCSVCLWIAVTVFTAAVVIFCEKFPRGGSMKRIIKDLSIMVLASAVGLSIAILGVTNKSANAAGNPYLGKADSTTVVYFVSDWFCPACRRLEPSLERIVPEIAKTVKVGFVDYPVHKETLNFTPYSLQFLYYEKDKYISLRKALSSLSLKTKNPTAGEVQAAVAPLGVKLREVNYAEILAGMQADQAVYRGFGLKATPSVVVTDLRTRKVKIIVGDNEITLQAIKAAIDAIK